jgi:outer membrane protein
MKINAIVGLVVVLTVLPLAAQSNSVGVWYSTAQIDDTEGLTFDDAKGDALSFNHFWTPSLSTEFAIHSLRSKAGVDVDGQRVLSAGKLKLRPITADVQWHFLRDSRFSPYVGAGVAYVLADDLSSEDFDLAGIGTVDIGNEFTWNANAGLDIWVYRSFGVAIDGKYIALEPDAKAAGGSEKLKLNPLVISAGVKFRF